MIAPLASTCPKGHQGRRGGRQRLAERRPSGAHQWHPIPNFAPASETAPPATGDLRSLRARRSAGLDRAKRPNRSTTPGHRGRQRSRRRRDRARHSRKGGADAPRSPRNAERRKRLNGRHGEAPPTQSSIHAARPRATRTSRRGRAMRRDHPGLAADMDRRDRAHRVGPAPGKSLRRAGARERSNRICRTCHGIRGSCPAKDAPRPSRVPHNRSQRPRTGFRARSTHDKGRQPCPCVSPSRR